MPHSRTSSHPYFCYDHARKESRARVAEKLGNDLASFFSGEYLSACDLTTAIGSLIPAVVRGDIKPKAAATVAYLSQTLVQALPLAHQEYTNAVGLAPLNKTIRDGIILNFRHRYPKPLPPPIQQQPQPAPPVANSGHPAPSTPEPDHPTESVQPVEPDHAVVV